MHTRGIIFAISIIFLGLDSSLYCYDFDKLSKKDEDLDNPHITIPNVVDQSKQSLRRQKTQWRSEDEERVEGMRRSEQKAQSSQKELDPSKFSLKRDSHDWFKVYCGSSYVGSIKQSSSGKWHGHWAESISSDTWLGAAMQLGQYNSNCRSH